MPAVDPLQCRRAKSSAALTLVEILVAVTILSFALGPIVMMFSFASRSMGSSAHRVQAQFLAHGVLESLQAEMRRFPQALNNYPWRFEFRPVSASNSYFERAKIEFFNHLQGTDKPIMPDSPLYEEFRQFHVRVDFSGIRAVRTVTVTVSWLLEGKTHSLELRGSVEPQPYRFSRYAD